MKDDPDHKLVSVLVDLVNKPTDEPKQQTKPPPPRSPRRVIDIVAWSSITNLALFACFAVGWNYNSMSQYLHGKPLAALSGKSGDKLPDPATDISDLIDDGLQRQLKGPLRLTLVPAAPADASVDTASAEPAPDGQEGTAAEQGPDDLSMDQGQGDQMLDQGDGSGEVTVGPEDPSQQAKSPVLRKGAKIGDVEIGSFTTISFSGGNDDCLETAYGMLEDVGASRDKLKVLADSQAIKVARICASNGSLVVTCRMDQITISPRKLKPNENCTG